MFARDQPKIGHYAKSSPEALARTMQFVILTVQQPLERVENAWQVAEEGGEDALGVLFGWKFHAYTEAWEKRFIHFAYIHHCEHSFHEHGDTRRLARELLEYFAGEYGYGLVKAGFIAQLVFGKDVEPLACLDTHNMKRFGLKERTFDNYCQLKSAKGRRAKVERYLDACASAGGTQALWDSWCTYVADLRPERFSSPAEVSAMHYEALGLL